jgi:predicted DNA-binding transcriptional regulator AlpA
MIELETKQQVAKRLGFHPNHVMRLAQQGKFPAPIKLGSERNSVTRFVVEEVEAWIGERMAARATSRPPKSAGLARGADSR